MPYIKFQNPVFKQGLNYTIRLWKHQEYKIGDMINIVKNDELNDMWKFGIIHIKQLILCSYNDIPIFVFDNEHDPKCRTIAEAYIELSNYYLEQMQEDERNAENNPDHIPLVWLCIGFEVFLSQRMCIVSESNSTSTENIYHNSRDSN